jgi:hypothetical protein
MLKHITTRLETGFESKCSNSRATGTLSAFLLFECVLNRWIQFLFLEPNAADPLNKEAAEDLKSNRQGFIRNVRTSMSGGSVRGESFQRVLLK